LPIHTEFEYSIQASRDFVFDWFQDLSPDDTKLAKPLKERKVLSKSPTEAKIQDTETILGKKVNLDVHVLYNRSDYSWTGTYTSNLAEAKSEYKLSSESAERTTLRYNSTIVPKGFFPKLVSPIIAYAVKRTFKGEFDVFKTAIESEFKDKLAMNLNDLRH
jgi:hypothetical protein